VSELRTARSTVEQVSAELRSLRGYDGLKRYKLVSKKHLLRLDAVIADAVKRKMTDDLPTVAYSLLECVLLNQPGLIPESSRFFVATELNLTGISDEYDVRKSTVINSWGRENRYYRTAERSAYDDVAVVLIRLEGSPCSVDPTAARAEGRQKALQALRDDAFATMMTSLLKELALADSPEQVEEISRRVLASLEGARRALRRLDYEPANPVTATRVVAHILSMVLNREYSHWKGYFSEDTLYFAEVSMVLGVYEHEGALTRVVEFRDDSRMTASLDLLGRVIADIDKAERWPAVLAPDSTRESAPVGS
jgi:hypothetical protein